MAPITAKKGVKVYLDGKKDIVAQAASKNTPCETGNRSIFIAHREDGQFLNAVIAQVRMWERILTIAEMSQAMRTNLLAVQARNKLSMTWAEIKSPL